MFSLISFRSYMVIAAFTAALLAAITQFASAPVAGFFRSVQSDAIRTGLPRAAADFIAEPIILAVTEPVAAVVAGLLWPFLILWFLLLVLLVVFAFMAPLITQARCAVTNC